MRLHYPLNANGAEDAGQLPWSDGVPSTGAQGSYPGHAIVTDSEAEILAAIDASGQSRSGTNLAQLIQAIARGIFLGQLTGSANALAAAIPNNVVFSALLAGTRFTGLVTTTNTAGATFAITGIGLASGTVQAALLTRSGNALQPGDLPVNQLFEFRWDGSAFRMIGPVTSETVAAINQTGAIPAAQTKILNVVGSGVWTVPVGVYLLRRVRMWGGGGGGGGASSTSSAGAAGGPGAYWEGAIPVAPGQQIAYTVGAAGAAGLGGTSPTNGGPGGTTAFGSYVTCPGASGGNAANGGVNPNPGLGSPATQAASLSGFIAPIAGAGIGYPVGSGYGGGLGAPAFGVSNSGPNVQAGGIPGIYPGSGGNGSSANANGGAGAAGLIIIDY